MRDGVGSKPCSTEIVAEEKHNIRNEAADKHDGNTIEGLCFIIYLLFWQ